MEQGELDFNARINKTRRKHGPSCGDTRREVAAVDAMDKKHEK